MYINTSNNAVQRRTERGAADLFFHLAQRFEIGIAPVQRRQVGCTSRIVLHPRHELLFPERFFPMKICLRLGKAGFILFQSLPRSVAGVVEKLRF